MYQTPQTPLKVIYISLCRTMNLTREMQRIAAPCPWHHSTLLIPSLDLESLVSKKLYHIDARHEKTDLKVFVVVIPKEGWVHVAAPILFFGIGHFRVSKS